MGKKKKTRLDIRCCLLQSAPIVNNRYFLVCGPATEKLEIVQCDLEKKDQIGQALGNV